MSFRDGPLPAWPKRIAKRFDCGAAGKLTVADIARATGLTTGGVHDRIARGWRGEQLVAGRCAPKPPAETFRGRAHLPEGCAAIYLGVCVARRFGDKVPSVDALREQFGVCRATAYRWRAAYAAALGVCA